MTSEGYFAECIAAEAGPHPAQMQQLAASYGYCVPAISRPLRIRIGNVWAHHVVTNRRAINRFVPDSFWVKIE